MTSFRGADATITEYEARNKFDNLFAAGDRFLAVSDSIRARLLELGCPADKIEILRSGVDLDAFKFREPRGLHAPIRLLTIGRLAPTKGIEYSLDAVRMLVDEGYSLEYRIVGDGPRRSELTEYVAKLGLESTVTFAGAVSADAIVEILRESDVIIAPSIVAASGQTEGVPNVLKEAMAIGVPAIGTKVGGVAELLEHGINGFIVPQKSAEAIADCVRQIVSNQEDMPRMLAAARKTIEQDYDLARLNSDLEKLYVNASGAN